jgi:hypothetical protein
MATRKSYHQHLREEREEAVRQLEKAKSGNIEKATIYLKDTQHTVLIVKRECLKKKLAELRKEGKKIQRIL